MKARDAADLVEQMRASSWVPKASVIAYREAAARRAELMTGKKVRASTDHAFVADMIAVGELEPL
jgi:hypothetical protein